MRKTILTLAFVALLVITPLAAAQSQIIFDDFEDGNLNGWSNTADYGVTSTNPLEGQYSMEYTAGGTNFNYYSITPDNYSTASVLFRAQSLPTGTNGIWIAYQNNGAEVLWLDIRDYLWVQAGAGAQNTSFDLEANYAYEFKFNDVNYTDNDYRLTVRNASDGTLLHEDTYTFDTSASELDEIEILSRGTDFTTDLYASGTTVVPSQTTTTLELEIDRWMPFNSTQDYTVILNETNTTTGDRNLTDVTANATVLSSNSSIVAVNNTSDTLESQNITGISTINASYDGQTTNGTNVTVADRNISNIGILPPEEWLCGFLECDYDSGGDSDEYGLGSPMQFILLIVVIMHTAARMFSNPWAGLGAGLMAAILIWVLGYVPIGIALITTFYVILASIVVSRTPRKSETNVTVSNRFGRG